MSCPGWPTPIGRTGPCWPAWAAAVAELSRGGYTVVVDGIIGPWYLDLVTDRLRPTGAAVHYVVLRPRLDVTLARGTSRGSDERVPGHRALVDEGPIRLMWERFQDLGAHERHVIDTSAIDPVETAELVWTRFTNGVDRI